MINWTAIIGFDWDEGNARKSADKHDVSQPEAEQAFLNRPLLVSPDSLHSQQEPRYHALGTTDTKRRLHLTFMVRSGAAGRFIRIISARDMHRKERTKYEQTKKNS
jgi:uncharacterized protein